MAKQTKAKKSALEIPTQPQEAEWVAQRSELLPTITLRDFVIFPSCMAPLYVSRPRSAAALEEATQGNRRVFLVAQKFPDIENPAGDDLYSVGTIGEILQVMPPADGMFKILVEGQTLARVLGYQVTDRIIEAMVMPLAVQPTPESEQLTALVRVAVNLFERYVSLSHRIPDEIFLTVRNLEDPLVIANLISHYINIKTAEKQELLEELNVERKLRKLVEILKRENELLALEEQITQQVAHQIAKNQKEYFLNEKLKAIEHELGIQSDEDEEIEELEELIARSRMSREAREKAERELSRLAKMAPMSPEATVSRTYIEWLLDLPWGKFTRDKTDIAKAQQILDSQHYGLEKVKDRILEFLAVHQLTKHVTGPILCLVGPPGVGKTSLARSIAQALGRKFVRVSLGGIRDEAEIRGHRRTYVGSLPGRIIQGMKKAGSMNPVFLLDEVDKMSSDFRGDPASALLEVLDPEQNKNFSDHYLEVDFDLSRVLFITTANTVEGIPLPLLDRMELIRIPGYTEYEKLKIAEMFLVPKQLKAHGLNNRRVKFETEAIRTIITAYTREAGVRNLEREIARICRRVAREILAKGTTSGRRGGITITPDKVREYLGPVRYRDLEVDKKPAVGVATGLAWTEVGGEILPTEVTVMKGRGNLVLTGKLGEVMQESAKTALSYIRSRQEELNIPRDFYRTLDIHIHIPEGAVPKDGPSAGVTMATSMVSALTNRPVRQDVAMTGEITLRGKVLKIGGLKEKILAAHRAHIHHVIIPHENEDELEEIPAEIRQEMKFTLVDTVDEVLQTALLRKSGN
ncbi:MAG: endopeptidase La [Candidatus Hydrogenedentota bacterium]|uniref:Lon protease n=1 Tax=Sumerlaea chitinivorans TaxID=2250252 RepID=A0A2Z4Y6E6_SUMC1|nr:ATP-dependent protease La [Candidatus Sumerlaea chitinivorans]RMH30398.1 MAG: endopeptidase La [Candidatus Hydrogenedentota bacterium]